MPTSRAWLTTRRRQLISLAAVALVACHKDTTAPATPPPRIPATMLIVAGQSQSGTVGAQLPTPLRVRVLDSSNAPLGGQVVNFHVVSGGGQMFAGVNVTDDSGVAQDLWTLGIHLADSQRVEARAVDNKTGAALTFATFSAIPLPGLPDTIVKVHGDSQAGAPSTALADSLMVRVADRYGNPVVGATVSWTTPVGGGSLAPPMSTVDSAGRAWSRWVLGARLDTVQLASASAGPRVVSFLGVPLQPLSDSLIIVPANDTVAIGTPLSLNVLLKDSTGRVLSGFPASWSSAEPAYATVSGAGVVQGVSVGVATIQGTVAGRSATTIATVAACDTFAAIDVNAFHVPTKGGALVGAGTGVGVATFGGTSVIYGGGAAFGDASHFAVGYDADAFFASSFQNGSTCTFEMQPDHRTFARIVLAAGSSVPAGLVVTQQSFAFSAGPDSGYVLIRYDFQDTSQVSITGFYASYLVDFDVLFDGSAADDWARYDTLASAGVVSETDTVRYPGVVGLAAIGTGTLNFRSWTNNGTIHTVGDYFSFASGGIVDTLSHPTDVRELVGLGPLQVDPGSRVVVYFALVGGGTHDAFRANLSAARAKAAAIGFQ